MSKGARTDIFYEEVDGNGPQCLIFALPRELRDSIYEHLLIAPGRLVPLPFHDSYKESKSERCGELLYGDMGNDADEVITSYE